MPKLESFYFTYGTSETQHHYGGHVKILAPSYGQAREFYLKIYGSLAFAFQYTEKEWEKHIHHGFNQECYAEYSSEKEVHECQN